MPSKRSAATAPKPEAQARNKCQPWWRIPGTHYIAVGQRAIREAKKQQLLASAWRPAIWDLVIADMKQRDAVGLKTYGKRLTAGNGRDALQDAYEEALDMAAYLKQAIVERGSNAHE